MPRSRSIIGSPRIQSGDFGVVAQVDAVEGERVGHPVDHAEGRLVDRQLLVDLAVAGIGQRLVRADVVEALDDRLPLHSQREQSADHRRRLVLEVQ